MLSFSIPSKKPAIQKNAVSSVNNNTISKHVTPNLTPMNGSPLPGAYIDSPTILSPQMSPMLPGHTPSSSFSLSSNTVIGMNLANNMVSPGNGPRRVGNYLSASAALAMPSMAQSQASSNHSSPGDSRRVSFIGNRHLTPSYSSLPSHICHSAVDIINIKYVHASSPSWKLPAATPSLPVTDNKTSPKIYETPITNQLSEELNLSPTASTAAGSESKKDKLPPIHKTEKTAVITARDEKTKFTAEERITYSKAISYHLDVPINFEYEALDESLISELKLNGVTGSVALFVLPLPGQTSKAVYHNSIEELWVCLSGTGQVITYNGEKVSSNGLLLKGKTFYIRPKESFEWKNTSATPNNPLVILGFTLPSWPKDKEEAVLSPTLPPLNLSKKFNNTFFSYWKKTKLDYIDGSIIELIVSRQAHNTMRGEMLECAIRPGLTTKALQYSSSATESEVEQLCFVHSGTGSVWIQEENKLGREILLEKNIGFCIPRGAVFQYHNNSSNESLALYITITPGWDVAKKQGQLRRGNPSWSSQSAASSASSPSKRFLPPL